MEAITTKNLAEFAPCIPAEYITLVREGTYKALGERFSDEAAGAIVWDAQENCNVLKSIYVLPPYRLLSIGQELYDAMDDGTPVSFSYQADGERALLEPFFNAIDVLTERDDAPNGHIRLSDARIALEKHGVGKVPETGSFYGELLSRDQQLAMRWLFDTVGAAIAPYTTNRPLSVYNIAEGEVISVILLRENEAQQLEIDYLFSKPGHEKALMGMLKKALNAASLTYSDNTLLEMLLASDQSRLLYKNLFGETDRFITIIYKHPEE